jgi:hypothetical protein
MELLLCNSTRIQCNVLSMQINNNSKIKCIMRCLTKLFECSKTFFTTNLRQTGKLWNDKWMSLLIFSHGFLFSSPEACEANLLLEAGVWMWCVKHQTASGFSKTGRCNAFQNLPDNMPKIYRNGWGWLKCNQNVGIRKRFFSRTLWQCMHALSTMMGKSNFNRI